MIVGQKAEKNKKRLKIRKRVEPKPRNTGRFRPYFFYLDRLFSNRHVQEKFDSNDKRAYR